jgi:hypothetical protein
VFLFLAIFYFCMILAFLVKMPIFSVHLVFSALSHCQSFGSTPKHGGTNCLDRQGWTDLYFKEYPAPRILLFSHCVC